MSLTAKAARINFGDMKRSEAADKLGITVDKLYLIESGKQIPDVNLALKMSELYQVPVDELNFFKS